MGDVFTFRFGGTTGNSTNLTTITTTRVLSGNTQMVTVTDVPSELSPSTGNIPMSTTLVRPQSGCSGTWTSHNCASPELSAVVVSNLTEGGLPQNEADCLSRCSLVTVQKGWISNACCRWYLGGKFEESKRCLLYPGAFKESGESLFVKSALMACH